jgi:hypothetical protein
MFGSVAPWAATGYVASYVLSGTVLFVITFAALVLSGVLSLFTFGVPLLADAALVVHGCAQIERSRAGIVGRQVEADYRQVDRQGLLGRIRTRWSDSATHRDIAYLVLLYLPLLALDVATLVIWLVFLSGVALPLWYWSIPSRWGHGVALGYFPNSPQGTGAVGVWVGDLPIALGVAVVFAILSLLASYLVVGAARLHGALVARLLGPYRDPLAEAKRVLVLPGPLST